MQNSSTFTPQLTADGSFTFFSPEFEEYFHSTQGAKEEALIKFVEPCQIAQKAQQPVVRLLDVCYGLSYNTAAALEVIWARNPNCYVEVIALELDATVPRSAIAHHLLNSWSSPIPELLEELATSLRVQSNQLHAQLLLGDARATIQQVYQSDFRADAIFLDAFSPRRCPQLWTVEFCQRLAGCCASTGILSTYSCAASVRSALMAAGFKLGQTPPLRGRQPGTVASFSEVGLPPLPLRSHEHMQTRAAVPFRDPHLCDPAPIILQRRQTEQQASTLEPTSHWQKRWSQRGVGETLKTD
jgi:tRNA U34 5-methylaminomethyl-2-thiouridine-forming methyltransferase MnmC